MDGSPGCAQDDKNNADQNESKELDRFPSDLFDQQHRYNVAR